MSASANQREYTVSEALNGLTEDIVRRKGSQRGSVRRAAGKWYIEYFAWVADESGNLQWRRQCRPVEGATSRRDAERKGYQQHVGRANELCQMPAGLATLKQFIEARFQPDHIDRLKLNGRILYHSMLKNHVLPTLGDMQLRAVTPQLVQQLISSKLAAGLSVQTVTHVRNVLSAVFRHARSLKFFGGELPTEGVKLPEMVRAERGALTWDQVLMLVQAVPPSYKPLVIVLAQTGMRIGEAAGLIWRRVNLSDEWRVSDGEAIAPNSILIASNWTRGERTTLKGRGKWRKVPLTTESWVALMTQYEQSKWRGEDQPVFAGQTGRPLDPHNVANRVLKPAARKIGLGWICFHVLRHTSATLADKAGLTAAEKQKILGHSTEAMSQHYTHPELDGVRAKLERLN